LLVEDGQLRPGPVALFGSPSLWSQLQQVIGEGRDWWYGDHAYFGRFRYYRITRGTLQLDGTEHRSAPASRLRFEALGVKIRPWRTTGDHILVCPPDRIYAGLIGFDADRWLQAVLEDIKRHSRRPIRVRCRELGEGRGCPLSEDLEGAWCMVTYTSNAAVEALCAGIPVICTGPCAGRLLGSGSVSEVRFPRTPPGRVEWAAWLAANQWTMDEIAAGDCWRAIGKG